MSDAFSAPIAVRANDRIAGTDMTPEVPAALKRRGTVSLSRRNA